MELHELPWLRQAAAELTQRSEELLAEAVKSVRKAMHQLPGIEADFDVHEIPSLQDEARIQLLKALENSLIALRLQLEHAESLQRSRNKHRKGKEKTEARRKVVQDQIDTHTDPNDLEKFQDELRALDRELSTYEGNVLSKTREIDHVVEEVGRSLVRMQGLLPVTTETPEPQPLLPVPKTLQHSNAAHPQVHDEPIKIPVEGSSSEMLTLKKESCTFLQPPTDTVYSWATKKALEAVHECGKTALMDMTGLLKVGEQLPKEHQDSWRAAVHAVEELQFSWKNSRIDKQTQFAKFLQHFNSQFFIERGMFLRRYSQRFAKNNRTKNGFRDITLDRALGMRRYNFRDHQVPVVLLHSPFPRVPESESSSAYDPVQGYGMLSLNAVRNEAAADKKLVYSSESDFQRFLQTYRIERHSAFLIARKVLGGKELHSKDIFEEALARSICDLVSRGIDGKCACSRCPEMVDANYLEYYDRLAHTIFSPQVIKRFGTGEHGAPMDRGHFGQAVSRLSAMLTVSALSRHPSFELLTWSRHLERLQEFDRLDDVVGEIKPGVTTAVMGMTLLAEKLGISSPGGRNNLRELYEASTQVFQTSPPDLRRAEKSVYTEIFSHREIDEFPFHRITEDGYVVPQERAENFSS